MAYKGRRRIDRVLLVVGAAAIGGVAAIAAAAGDGERIGRYWASAVVDEESQAAVTEVIDYDFGVSDRHGIFRDVRGLDRAAPVQVQSPTAPDEFIIEPGSVTTRIRIGDPDTTISGRHRYRIDYPIAVGFDDQLISWNAVGPEWEVGMRNVEVHLLATTELTDIRCSQGEAGSWDGCEVTQPEPGHLVAMVDKLDSMEGVTISGTATGNQAQPTAPTPPDGPAPDPGTGVVPPLLTAALVALAASAVASILVRRFGQELVWAGGSADAAFGPQFDEDYPVRRVDHEELSALASTEFAPPKGLSAWQGGILHSETTTKDHQVAWLLERAIAGEVEIEGSDDDLTLRLTDDDPSNHDLLHGLFGGRRSIKLDKYDKQFATGWTRVLTELGGWDGESNLWDPQGARNRTRAYGFGIPAVIVGLILMVLSAVVANRSGSAWLVGVAVGAALVGGGWATLLRSWELRIRTPEGSGLWILVESFRRFINKSDAQHVDAAAKQGLLLDYTAWAVALGEVDRWSKAVKDAGLEQSVSPQTLSMVALAPHLGSATSSAATAPSSSGGGGGGSVGGGGGGGGGGSW